MIGVALILGALVAGAALAVFWKDIVNWLKNAFQKIKDALKRTVLGVEVFVKRCIEGLQRYSYHYSKSVDNKWTKDTVIEQQFVDESEIPDDIKKLAYAKQIGESLDISSQMNNQLMALQNG